MNLSWLLRMAGRRPAATTIPAINSRHLSAAPTPAIRYLSAAPTPAIRYLSAAPNPAIRHLSAAPNPKTRRLSLPATTGLNPLSSAVTSVRFHSHFHRGDFSEAYDGMETVTFVRGDGVIVEVILPKCPICGKSFGSNIRMKDHYYRTHSSNEGMKLAIMELGGELVQLYNNVQKITGNGVR